MAVVKYPVDAEPKVKRRELLEGLGMIAMELVAEHNYTIEQIEDAFIDAQGDAEQEFEMKRQRESKDNDG